MQALEAGADDFLSKPVNWEELFARVRSLLRIKRLQDEIRAAERGARGARARQVAELERLGRLKRDSLAPQVAEAIVAGGEDVPRARIGARSPRCSSTCAASPRSPIAPIPRRCWSSCARITRARAHCVDDYGGTLEHFAGDGVMIFFNDPLPVDRPAERAVRMALALQRGVRPPIAEAWAKLGHDVGLGIGIAQGEATLGVIGFEQRWEYAAIGNVPNLAARLSDAAAGNQILISARVHAAVEHRIQSETVGPSRSKASRGQYRRSTSSVAATESSARPPCHLRRVEDADAPATQLDRSASLLVAEDTIDGRARCAGKFGQLFLRERKLPAGTSPTSSPSRRRIRRSRRDVKRLEQSLVQRLAPPRRRTRTARRRRTGAVARSRSKSSL